MRIELKLMVWAAAFMCVLGSNGLVLGNDGALPNACVCDNCATDCMRERPTHKTLVFITQEGTTVIPGIERCDALAAWMQMQWDKHPISHGYSSGAAAAMCFGEPLDEDE